MQRRKRLAATAPLPPVLAMLLTPSQVAYARLVSNEHQRHGVFDWCHARAAAIAGFCPETAKRSQRRLQQLGLISIERLPMPGKKSLSNLVRIVDAKWLSWIDGGPPPRPYPWTEKQPLLPVIGEQKGPPTFNRFLLLGAPRRIDGIQCRKGPCSGSGFATQDSRPRTVQ